MNRLYQRGSPLDPIIPPLFNALILCFPCSSIESESIVKILQESLSTTVRERPYLAGEIVTHEITVDSASDDRPGELSLRSSNDSNPNIHMRINDMTQPGHGWEFSYAELRKAGMPVSKLDGAYLAPLSGYNTTSKVMAAQANLIDGGILLSVYFLHSFVDAFGASLVMGAWANNCRKLQGNFRPPPPPLPGTESTSAHLARLTAPTTLQLPSILTNSATSSPISRQENYETLKIRPELWKLLGLDWRPRPTSSAPPFQNKSIIRTIIFSTTPTSLEKLKRDASPNLEALNGQETTSWISTKDALAALLWRCIMKARFPSSSKSTSDKEEYNSIIAVAMDGRRSLGIPIDYIGNVIFESMTELDLGTLISPDTSLATIATSLRRSLEDSKSPDLLNDAVSLASCIPDLRSLGYAIPDWLGRDLILTSWVDMPYYEHVWGPMFGNTGKTEFFRMPKGQFEGICSVQPRQPTGKVEVVIGLEAEQMQRLRTDPELCQYLSFESE